MKGNMSCNMHNEVPPPILIQNIGAKNGTKNGTNVNKINLKLLKRILLSSKATHYIR